MAGMGAFGGMAGGGMGQQEREMRMMQVMQEMQMSDSLRMYNELVERCFGECVDTFRSRKLDGKEENCIKKCSEKFVKFAARAGMRFQEHQQQMALDASKAASGQ